MTDPLETRGATGAAGATFSDQGLIRPHRAGATRGHRGHASGPAPLAPPGPNDVGPRNPLKNNPGPTGPTGPTANEVPDVVRAVLATFESLDDPRARLDEAHDIFRERAAIREYDSEQDRAKAEAAAWQETMRAAGITALDERRQGSERKWYRQHSWKMERGKR